MTTKLEHALLLADQGFYVFPCDPSTNEPILPWREHSTRNPKTIKDWFVCPFMGWAQDYNIGVDCYKSGVTAIDVDVKMGKQGRASFEKWQNEFGWGVTRMQRTTSGGFHLIYKASGFKNSVEKLAPGIDVRSDGGFYIAAGSTKGDKVYTLEHDIEPKLMPKWLEDKLTALGRATPTEARDSSKVIVEDKEEDIESAIRFLKTHPPAVQGDAGDIHTYKTFCQLKEKGISIRTALDLVEDHWNPECSPPWDSDALIEKANSAYAHAQNATGVKSPYAEFDIPKDEPKAAEPPPSYAYAPGWTPKVEFDIPRREWVIPGMAQKKKVMLLVSEPGVGKSTLTLGAMLSKATGQNILGFDTGERGAVAVFNNEDDVEEMERRLVAYMKHHAIHADALFDANGKPLMFINSGELKRLRIAKKDAKGVLVPDAVQSLIEYITANNIKLLIVDPFAETHPAQENSNEDIGLVAAMFRHVAQKGDCAVILVHHTKKPDKALGQGGGGDMNLSRGASSLLGVARSVWTLTNMTEKDAALFGIPESERHLYVVFEQAKANMAAPGGNKKFFKRLGITLLLAPDDIDGESVGILKPEKLVANPGPAKADDIQFLHAMEDVLESEDRTYADLATAIIQLPEYSDKQHDAIVKRIRRLLSEGTITGFKGVIMVEESTLKGRKVKRIHLKKHSKLETADII